MCSKATLISYVNTHNSFEPTIESYISYMKKQLSTEHLNQLNWLKNKAKHWNLTVYLHQICSVII